MESQTSQDKAIPLFNQAVHDASLLGVPPEAIGNLFVDIISYPGYVVNKLSQSRFGQFVIGGATGALGAILLSRLKRYLKGDPTMQHATDFFNLPRTRTMNDLKDFATATFTHLWKKAFAAPWRLTTDWTRAYKRFKKLKLTQHQHITRPYTIPYQPALSLAKNAAIGAGALGLGTAALKYTGRLFRKLLHKN